MHSDDGDDNRELKPFLCPALKKPASPFEIPRHTIDTILELTITNKMNVSDIMGTPSSINGSSSPSQDSNITLWQFLLELLEQKKNSDIIQWILPREKGEFKLIDAEAVAKLWGQRKGKAKMNYDKLSRALRYYYDKGIIKKVVGQKFVYQFPASASVLSSEAARTSSSSSNEYHNHNHQMKVIKEEKDYDMMMPHYTPFPMPTPSTIAPVSSSSFSALSLMNTSSPNTTAHSVATPSPSDSACSPSSSSSVSSSTASLMIATTSISPMPSTSSPHPDDHQSVTSSSGGSVASVNHQQKRKRPDSPSNSTPLSSSSSEPQPRRTKPNPLNLTATSNFLTPTSTFSPMMLLHQNSPLLQPAIQLYATLASAGLYGPQMSPLFAAASPFRSPLTTPGAVTSAAQQQVFQFPPTSSFSTTSLINPFPSLFSPGAPFMMSTTSNNSFKFPSSDSLKTPTVPLKMPSL